MKVLDSKKKFGNKVGEKFLIPLLLVLMMPFFVNGQERRIVPSCPKEGCGWAELIMLFNSILNFIVILVFIVLGYRIIVAGFLLLTSGFSAANIERAKSTILSALIGSFFALTAWLIVNLILDTLLKENSNLNPTSYETEQVEYIA